MSNLTNILKGKRNSNPVPDTLPNRGIWAWPRAKVMYDRLGTPLVWYGSDGVTVDAFAVQIQNRDYSDMLKSHKFGKLYVTKPWKLDGAKIAG